MKNNLLKIVLFFFIFPFLTLAQKNSENKFTGNLKTDSEIALAGYNSFHQQIIPPQVENHKSPILAGLMSLVIPGLGEVYTKNYLKAAIFAAVEAAVITTAIIYDKKGDDQTDLFEDFADENWSVVKYAEWLNKHKGTNISINHDPNLPAWEQVNWQELNNAESQFSHKLPPHGAQQYYELIGKYSQYNHGWADQMMDTPEYLNNLTPMFRNYSSMRGQANDFYSVASTAVIGIYINHFLSALDAVWSASLYNKNIGMKVRVQQNNFADRIEYMPTINLQFNF
jgi:hypothetical protein